MAINAVILGHCFRQLSLVSGSLWTNHSLDGLNVHEDWVFIHMRQEVFHLHSLIKHTLLVG